MEPLELAAQREVVECAGDRDREHVDLHRLLDEVERARAHRGDGRIEIADAGDDDRERDPGCADLLTELDAGHAGHLHVGYDHVRRLPGEARERLHTGPCGFDFPAPLRECVAQQLCGVLVVVDDENLALLRAHVGLRPYANPMPDIMLHGRAHEM